jgi:hypothetical protein
MEKDSNYMFLIFVLMIAFLLAISSVKTGSESTD